MTILMPLILFGLMLYALNSGAFYGPQIKEIEESMDEPTKAIPPEQLEQHYRAMLKRTSDAKEAAVIEAEILKAIATGDDAKSECPHDPKCDSVSDCELTEKIYQANRTKTLGRFLNLVREEERKTKAGAREGKAGEESP